MELHTLKPAEGSKKKRKRVGHGTGSGLGKTSGRGHKGAGQRSGFKKYAGHEGGQMPLHRRLPKRGFNNIFKKEYQIVNVADLGRCESGDVNSETLKSAGLIRKINIPVKVLGNGDVKKVYTVKAKAFSMTAVAKIEEAGGTIEVI
ncbi:MAG: 50S ribosomal protein L15 [candidate division Zixibacteria bacterium]|nr:50S ribosomal protein L15 [candidate division Zixibacteria bacterium]